MFKMFKDSNSWGFSNNSSSRSSIHSNKSRRGSNASMKSNHSNISNMSTTGENSNKFGRRTSSMSFYLENILTESDKPSTVSSVFSSSASSPSLQNALPSTLPTITSSPPNLNAALDEVYLRKNSVDVDSLLALQDMGVPSFFQHLPPSPEDLNQNRQMDVLVEDVTDPPLNQSSSTPNMDFDMTSSSSPPLPLSNHSDTLVTPSLQVQTIDNNIGQAFQQSPISPVEQSKSSLFVSHPYANLHNHSYQFSPPQLPDIVTESFANLQVDTMQRDNFLRESPTSPVFIPQWSPEMSEELTDLKKTAFQPSHADDVNAEGLVQATATITATLERRKTRRRNRSISERLASLTPETITKQDSTIEGSVTQQSEQQNSNTGEVANQSPGSLPTAILVTQDLMTPQMYQYAYQGVEVQSPLSIEPTSQMFSSPYQGAVSPQFPLEASIPAIPKTEFSSQDDMLRQLPDRFEQVDQPIVPSIRRGRAIRKRRTGSIGSLPASPTSEFMSLPDVAAVSTGEMSTASLEVQNQYSGEHPRLQIPHSTTITQPMETQEGQFMSLLKPTNYSPGSSPIPIEIVQDSSSVEFPQRTISKGGLVKPAPTIPYVEPAPPINQVPVKSPEHQDVDMLLSHSKSAPILRVDGPLLGRISPGVTSPIELEHASMPPLPLQENGNRMTPNNKVVEHRSSWNASHKPISVEEQPKRPASIVGPPRKSSREKEKDRRWSWFMDFLGPKKVKQKESAIAAASPKPETRSLSESAVSSQASSSSSSLPEADWDPYPRSSSLDLFTPSRLDPETEKLVYGLSHQKLAEPGRPLHHQVMIANFMMYILSVHADVTLMRRGPRTRRKKGPRGARKQRQPLVSFGPGLDMRRVPNATATNGASPSQQTSMSIDPSQYMLPPMNIQSSFLGSGEESTEWQQMQQYATNPEKDNSNSSGSSEEDLDEDEESPTKDVAENIISKEPLKEIQPPNIPTKDSMASRVAPPPTPVDRSLKKENRYVSSQPLGQPQSPQKQQRNGNVEKRNSSLSVRAPGRSSPPPRGATIPIQNGMNEQPRGRSRISRTPPPPSPNGYMYPPSAVVGGFQPGAKAGDRRSGSFPGVGKFPSANGRSPVSPQKSLVINPNLPYSTPMYGPPSATTPDDDEEEDDVPLGMLQQQRR